MLKKIYLCLLSFVVILALGSCKKDLGNYSYKEINEVKEFGGIADVTAIYGERFIIKPELKFTQDNGTDTTRYTYEWIYSGGNGLGGFALYTLATTRNLDVRMSLIAGTYPFYYGVTDKTTGVKYRKSFTVKVENKINEGWFLMCDVNGTARLDMLAKTTTGFDVVKDLLGFTSSGLVLKGKPKMVYSYNTGALVGPGINLPYGIYFGTDQSTDRVDPDNFKWQSKYQIRNEILGPVPPNFYADVIMQAGGTRSYMLGDGDIYNYNRSSQIKYSSPLNFIAAEAKLFKVAPFVATSETVNVEIPAIFYDTEHRRFVKHIGTAGSCTVIPDPAVQNKLFSFSTGMDLLYMVFIPSGSSGDVFSVLKDPGSSKKYIARFNGTSNAQSYYAEILGQDINNADFFAVSPDLGYLFYNVGSKVYEYDLSLKTSKLMLDKGASKISLLKFYQFKNGKYTTGNKLIVCSYNPGLPEGENGTMEMFTVPTLNADLTLFESHTGFGKVQSINYRER